MIYVPDTQYVCYVVQSEGVIRGYEQQPTYNSTINYRDWYIDSSYIYRDGYQQFGNYSTLPICLDKSTITNDMYYRLDFDSILLIFMLIVTFVYFVVSKMVKVFFLGFRGA